jgi:GTP-binding protein
MFVDEIRIFARAGHGGKGCVAFQREKFRPKGGPSGGNGGRGGSIFLEADHDLNNLIAQYYQPSLIAQNGEGGLGKGMDGHAGKDLIVKVPCGTLVWRLDSPSTPLSDTDVSDHSTSKSSLQTSAGKRPLFRTSAGARGLEVDLAEGDHHEFEGDNGAGSKGELTVDLTEHGQRFLLCKGGRGGLGNRNFATAARQAPRFAQPGEPGDEGDFLLELRIMAEVGLVGCPNAGKSTLLTAISRARPKIASYPFTTLHPQIGIVEYPDFHRLTVCDVPGLIEGAHRNAGLGHKFLRHIQRCKVLVIMLDMAGTDSRAPWDDYKDLLNELCLFDKSLLQRPQLVAANKMDEPAAEKNLKQFKRRVRKVRLLPISAAFGQGIDAFLKAIRKTTEEAESSNEKSGSTASR